jgi:hypothetical protein
VFKLFPLFSNAVDSPPSSLIINSLIPSMYCHLSVVPVW